MLRSLLTVLLGASLLLPTLCAGDEFASERQKVWLVAPRTHSTLTTADREARDSLLKLIEARQSKEFRKSWKVVVPNHSSGVPDKYVLSIYGKYIDAESAQLLMIRVDGAKAKAELVDSEGIWRGELPLKDLDQSVRHLAYAFQSQVQPRDDAQGGRGFRSASHAPSFIIELVADGKQPLQLRTESWQLLHNTIDAHSQGLLGWMHTRLCNGVLELAHEELRSVSREEQQRAIVRALKHISAEKKTGQYTAELLAVTDYQRDDRAAVEALLYPHLAVELAVADALPELQRLEAKEALKELEIVAAADPLPRLAAAIAGDDYDLKQWALEFAEKDQPRYVQMLVDLLPTLMGNKEGVVSEVLGRLRNRKLTAEQLMTVEAVFGRVSDPHTKAWTGAFLLDQTGDDRYYDFLMELARTRPPKPAEGNDAGRYAVSAALDYSARTKKRRNESYALLQKLLKGMPAEAKPDSFEYFELVEHWGGLGTRDDLPALEKLAEDKSGYLASSAIKAIAMIDPKLATRKARERVEGFVARRGDDLDYNWNVYAYLELFFWQNCREAVPALKSARELLSLEELEIGHGQNDPQPLIDYLEARDPAARLAGAVAFAKRRHVEPTWLKDVADALVTAGAKPEDCRKLLNVDQRRR